MNVCPNCGNPLTEGIRFCGKCGTSIPTHVTCGSCGATNPVNAPTCAACGAALAQKTAPAGKPAAKTDVMAVIKDFGSKIKAAIPKDLGEKVKQVPKQFWMIGGAALVVLIVLIVLLSSGGGVDYDYALYVNEDNQLSYTKLNGRGDPMEVTEEEAYRAYYATMASDGKTLFYLDYEDGESVLYYRNVKNPKKDPQEVESGISSFQINEDGSRVYYIKGGKLYVNNLKDDERIASDVSSFYLSENGKKLLYRDSDGGLYLWDGKDSEKMDSNVSYVEGYTADLKSVYYSKKGDLYLKKGNKDGERILSDFYSSYIGESGEGYVLKEDGDYYELYYVDGYNSERIASDISSRYIASDRAAAVYYVSEDEQWFVAVGKKTYELDVEDVYSARIAPDGKSAYFVTDVDDSHGDLYKVKIGSKPGKLEQVDEDVYYSYFGVNKGNQLYYFKDVKNAEGTLFVKGEEVAEDVLISSLTYNADKKMSLFITDWDSNNSEGTLNSYKSKVKVVEKNIYHNGSYSSSRDFFVMPDGEVLYFTDYEDGVGVLNCFNGSKSVELADDAVTYVPVYGPAD